MFHAVDPREDLRDKIGDISSNDLFHNQVMVAVYIAPQKMASGLWRPETNQEEDRYQSKVGLILKTGPTAFQSGGGWEWPKDMAIGDWVYFRISDSWPCTVNGNRDNLCRVLRDSDLRGRVSHPDDIW